MPTRRVILWLGWMVLIDVVAVFLLLAGCGGGKPTPPPGATETAEAGRVLATLTVEVQTTPTPSAEVETVAQEAFETWAQEQGEPYRDVVVTVGESDGFFALMRVVAWFRPARDVPWEEREAEVECRRVGEEWQYDQWFDFQLAAGEVARQVQATATAEARATATAVARATATAMARLGLRKLHPQWTSYTNANLVTDLLVQGDAVWAATTGSVVRWDMRTGEYVKITTEYGLADNSVWAIAVAPDGALWFGTDGDGVSRYEP